MPRSVEEISSDLLDKLPPETWNDPTKLLKALDDLEKNTVNKFPQSQTLWTIRDICFTYDVSPKNLREYIEDDVLSVDYEVKIDGIVYECFTFEKVERFVTTFSIKKRDDAIFIAFMKELTSMRMSYSYKPLLIKALIEHSNEDGLLFLNVAAQYFINFYHAREIAGLVIEKPNSTFYSCSCAEEVAIKTIIQYPYSVLMKKGFLYRGSEDQIGITPTLWRYLSDPAIKNSVIQCCDENLEKYYSRIK